MGNQRSLICLKCGNRFYVNMEDYRLANNNPVCPDCLIRTTSIIESFSKDSSSVSDGISFALKTAESIFSYASRKTNITQSAKLNEEDAVYTDDDVTNHFIPTKSENFKNIVEVGLNTVVNKLRDMPTSFLTETNDFENWECIGCLGDVYDNHPEILRKYNHSVGLYMHKINGKIMYIGRAVEYANGGLRKRLSDYCRPNGSARKHPSGQKIHANRYRIHTYILVVGSDAAAAEKSKKLEEQYVGKYNPPWNDKLKTL